MDKKTKQRRHKTLNEDELEEVQEVAPRGASFDTEEGRAAQGMRPDIGAGQSDEEQRRDEKQGAAGASDATSGGGAGAGIADGDTAEKAGDAVTRGDTDQDREKLFPEAKSKPKKET